MNLNIFTREFSSLVKSENIEEVRDKGGTLISELSLDPDFTDDCLARLLTDDEFMSRQKDSIWPNEVAVYRHPDRSYSLFMYIWDVGFEDIIHDHNAWGVIGAARGSIEEIKYRRLDDGSREGYAELEPLAAIKMNPGQVTSVLPLDRGIHQMRNVHQGISVTFNAYGPPVKRGYVRFYDREKMTAREAYTPRTLKRVLAVRALLAQSEHAEQVLERAVQTQAPGAVREEIRKGLSLFRNREFRSK